ncbi:hypothetical protein KQI65_02475 [bacterium]|nr:hypothetical protein [bacterium]
MSVPPLSLSFHRKFMYVVNMPVRVFHIAAAVLLLVVLQSCERERIIDPGPDTTAPLPPAGIVVEGARDGYIFVGWQENSERDLRGYIVYRAEQRAPQSFVPIDTLSINYIIDTQRSYDTTYYYCVTAIDQSGNESTALDTVHAVSENRADPDAPRTLNVNGYNDGSVQEIRISWDAVEEADLAFYRVYRGSTPIEEISESTLLTELPATAFHDSTGNGLNFRYYYAVTAVDNGGRESILSPGGSDIIAERPQPVAPVGGEKTVVYPLLSWLPVPGASRYLLSVSLSENTGEVWSSYANATGEDTLRFRYDGSALTPGEQYFWRVSSVTSANGKPNGISGAQTFVADD